MRRSGLLGAMALMLAVGLSSCGDDDEDKAAGPTTPAAGGVPAAVATYCQDSLAAETVEPDIDFDSLSEAEQMEAAKKFVNEEFKPIVERLKKSVPAEIEAPAQVLFATVDKVGLDGDFSVFEMPEVKAAETKVHAYDLANCGWGKVSATGVEYAFQGIPATVDAGVTSLDFKNGGKELHEMAVLKKKDGVTESFDEILALDEEEGQTKVDQVAGNFAAQGDTDYAVADLAAGDYLVVCFVPVGLTSEEAAPPENSPPHFTKGMKAEFKVT